MIESAGKSEQVLPSLKKALEEVGAVDFLLADYCARLQLMGDEIRQIEQLNRGLNIQTSNQQRLLAELDSILVLGLLFGPFHQYPLVGEDFRPRNARKSAA